MVFVGSMRPGLLSWILCAGVGLVVGYVSRDAAEIISNISEGSAVAGLSRQIIDDAHGYFQRNGRYPTTIQELGISDPLPDSASESTFRWLRYYGLGDAFILVRLEPGANLRDLWWCNANGACQRLPL